MVLWDFQNHQIHSAKMAPSRRDLQLTPLSGDTDAEIGAMEEVRLLDSYDDDNDDSLSKIEEGSGDSSSSLRKIQVGITGMTCAACSNSVEGALMSVNGVFKASVALLQNRADVLFDPNLVKVFPFLFFFLIIVSILIFWKIMIFKLCSCWVEAFIFFF